MSKNIKRPKQLDRSQIPVGAIKSFEEAMEKYMDFLEKKDPEDEPWDDLEVAVFEKALKAWYGPKVWDWISTRLV